MLELTGSDDPRVSEAYRLAGLRAPMTEELVGEDAAEQREREARRSKFDTAQSAAQQP